ncbi:MAG: hypothetical protein IIB41_07695 [Candidatus Marinimicrobia bacterium]|nr:hypothetical protein [Candidatus Neomarinimicrobiota bacterium]
MQEKKTLTKRELQKITGAPAYVITYLRECNKLPITKESIGRGYSTVYDFNAIEVIKEHLKKQSNGLEHEE